MEFEGRSRIREQLTVTPLIDVVFLLLVFFMLTSTFIRPRALDVTLPSSDSSDARPESPIEVLVDENGLLALNGSPLAAGRLEAELRLLLDGDVEQAIVVKSDAGVTVQKLVAVMDAVRAAGGRNMSLATKPARAQVAPAAEAAASLP